MILITGATGLTGSHLALHLLENGETVRAIYRKPESINKTKNLFQLYKKSELFDKIEWVEADICDIPSLETAFQNVEYVYHCAAFISFDPDDEELLRKTNIEGTANIVNFCLAYQVKKLCHVSSIAALGDLKPHEKLVTETTEWNPERTHNDYAITKYGAEMEIWRGQQEGLQAVIVNPGIILGPGFWHSGSGEIFALVKKGLVFYTKGVTGFVAVSDVVKIMAKLMKSEASGERFCVVSEALPFQQTTAAIADALHVSRPRIYATPWLTAFGWKIDWILANVFGQKRKISKHDAQLLHAKTLYSNDKIRKELDFEFMGIKEAIAAIVKIQQS